MMQCPGCRRPVAGYHECSYNHPRKRFLIRLAQGMPASVGTGMNHHALRVVDSMHDFMETVRIFDSELNDAMIAMLKRSVRQIHTDLLPADSHLRFHNIGDEGVLIFTALSDTAGDRYIVCARTDYDEICGKFTALLARSQQKGVWLKVDDAYLDGRLTESAEHRVP